jgi:hypothetical protein
MSLIRRISGSRQMPLHLIAMTMLTWQLIYVKCLSVTRHFLPGDYRTQQAALSRPDFRN